mmetsp:Transcript_20472/g.51081  ORF Transcript_20472/g.51081 Transcript_20472/m.51081 type:complete len:265 (-) Transcript_20472:45-839(-)
MDAVVSRRSAHELAESSYQQRGGLGFARFRDRAGTARATRLTGAARGGGGRNRPLCAAHHRERRGEAGGRKQLALEHLPRSQRGERRLRGGRQRGRRGQLDGRAAGGRASRQRDAGRRLAPFAAGGGDAARTLPLRARRRRLRGGRAHPRGPLRAVGRRGRMHCGHRSSRSRRAAAPRRASLACERFAALAALPLRGRGVRPALLRRRGMSRRGGGGGGRAQLAARAPPGLRAAHSLRPSAAARARRGAPRELHHRDGVKRGRG